MTVTGTSQQAAANSTYTVASTTTQTVVITLPRNEDLRVGNTVRVTGQSNARWQLAQNAQQYVVTTNVPGNVAPGTVWTPREPDAAAPNLPWSGTASSASGNRIAAIANPGGVYLSADGGATWTRTTLPSAAWTQVLMSTEGDRLAAVAEGSLYVSSDYGRTWLQRGSSIYWHAVHMSDDGQRIIGISPGAGLQLSTNGGTSFAQVTGTTGIDWRAIAGSTDGMRLVAGAQRPWGSTATNHGVYVSTDGGLTWTRRLGDVAWQGSDRGPGNWSFASASADGMRMAVLDNGGFPWVSADGGTSWEQTFSFSGWSGLAVSRDGRVVTAQEPRNDTYRHRGYVFINTTGGTGNWDWSAADLNLTWRGISLSSDGNWMAGADNGLPGAGGKIYTTSGNRTSGGTIGSITGGQAQSIQVTYEGNGRFTVTDVSGNGTFSIR